MLKAHFNALDNLQNVLLSPFQTSAHHQPTSESDSGVKNYFLKYVMPQKEGDQHEIWVGADLGPDH